MASPLRIEVASGWYHVIARGNERRAVFFDDRDRIRFLTFGECVDRFGLRLYAYVLKDNHYHPLVETPRVNLSQAMRWLQASYTMGCNRLHRIVVC